MPGIYFDDINNNCILMKQNIGGKCVRKTSTVH